MAPQWRCGSVRGGNNRLGNAVVVCFRKRDFPLSSSDAVSRLWCRVVAAGHDARHISIEPSQSRRRYTHGRRCQRQVNEAQIHAEDIFDADLVWIGHVTDNSEIPLVAFRARPQPLCRFAPTTAMAKMSSFLAQATNLVFLSWQLAISR
jgi:hypothetical protein